MRLLAASISNINSFVLFWSSALWLSIFSINKLEASYIKLYAFNFSFTLQQVLQILFSHDSIGVSADQIDDQFDLILSNEDDEIALLLTFSLFFFTFHFYLGYLMLILQSRTHEWGKKFILHFIYFHLILKLSNFLLPDAWMRSNYILCFKYFHLIVKLSHSSSFSLNS